ncbi:hypothetical protein EDB19DRAFT_1835403 [Suillus lakei]|nr:hypothetical protein EDB19DRAFT_1835403 [Suillus lakei]
MIWIKSYHIHLVEQDPEFATVDCPYKQYCDSVVSLRLPESWMAPHSADRCNWFAHIPPEHYFRPHLFHLFGFPPLKQTIQAQVQTDEDFTQWRVKDVTNLYNQLTINLHLEDLKALHTYIVSDWDEWVHNAPVSWKDDGWLQSHAPLSVALANWPVEQEYSNIHYMSMAIATDLTCILSFLYYDLPPDLATTTITINCKPVSQWEKIPEEQLLDAHNIIYDSPNSSFWQLKENNIYDEDSCQIPHFDGLCSPDVKPCGILINLETITKLFSAIITEDDDLAFNPDIIMDNDNLDIQPV